MPSTFKRSFCSTGLAFCAESRGMRPSRDPSAPPTIGPSPNEAGPTAETGCDRPTGRPRNLSTSRAPWQQSFSSPDQSIRNCTRNRRRTPPLSRRDLDYGATGHSDAVGKPGAARPVTRTPAETCLERDRRQSAAAPHRLFPRSRSPTDPR
jgi:hypothetical protein